MGTGKVCARERRKGWERERGKESECVVSACVTYERMYSSNE